MHLQATVPLSILVAAPVAAHTTNAPDAHAHHGPASPRGSRVEEEKKLPSLHPAADLRHGPANVPMREEEPGSPYRHRVTPVLPTSAEDSVWEGLKQHERVSSHALHDVLEFEEDVDTSMKARG